MRALVGWILALGLVLSPAMARAGGAAGTDSPAAAKTDKPNAPGTSAPAASNAAAAKPAPASLESELDELRGLIDSQSKQIQEQNEQLKQEQEKMKSLEEQLKASTAPATAPTPAPAAAPVTAAMAVPSTAASTAASTASLPSRAAAVAATPQDQEKPSPLYFSIGGAHFTPVGFMDMTNVFRSKAFNGTIGTNFNGVPFNNNFPAAGLTEDRFSTQNSRLGMRVDSKFAGGDVTGYIEADFLGNAANGLYTTSNSDTFRMRVYFLDFRRSKWEILAGQDWSMLTANRNGIGFMPGDVFYSQDMDTNYQLGLVWERTTQFRLVFHPSKTVALGVSVENPDQYIPSAQTAPGNGAVALPGSFSTSQVDLGGSGFTPPNVRPDLVAKLAFDPKFGMHSAHFEVAGVYRTFRINSSSGTTSFGNTTASGGGVAFNSNFELFKNFRILETAFWSSGGGRELANSGVPDFVVVPANTATGAPSSGNLLGISPVHSGSWIGGFEYQTTPKLMLYGYYSGVYVARNFGELVPGTPCTGFSSCYGYGFTGSGSVTANNDNRLLQETTIGFVPYFWRSPNYGTVQMINQFSYLTRAPWWIAPGAPKNAHTFMAWIDLRYVLP